jgi:hypothetical protein
MNALFFFLAGLSPRTHSLQGLIAAVHSAGYIPTALACLVLASVRGLAHKTVHRIRFLDPATGLPVGLAQPWKNVRYYCNIFTLALFTHAVRASERGRGGSRQEMPRAAGVLSRTRALARATADTASG